MIFENFFLIPLVFYFFYFFLKKNNFLIEDTSHSIHKIIGKENKSPILLGGVFFLSIILIFFPSIHILSKVIFLLIVILGISSDVNFLSNPKIRLFLQLLLISFLILLPTKYGVKLFFSRFNVKTIYGYLKESYREIFFNKFKNYYFNAMYKFKWNYRITYLIKYDFLRKKVFYNKQNNFLKILYFFIKVSKYFYFQLEIIFLYFLRIYLIFSLFFIVKKKKNFF